MTFSILCGMVNDIVIDEVIKKKKWSEKLGCRVKGTTIINPQQWHRNSNSLILNIQIIKAFLCCSSIDTHRF